jgi:L-ribulose-5-phosphate 3-epimerase UlaE
METAFMDTVTKAMNYVDLVNSPYLGVYPNIGNLKNASVLYGTDLLADIQRGTGHIFAAHLKETRPGIFRDMTFGTGHTEYESCIELLWNIGVRMFTGELWYQGDGDDEPIIRQASSFLRGKIKQVTQVI